MCGFQISRGCRCSIVSVSEDGIANRNKILLNEAQAIWAMNKAAGIGYEGDEDEVISKLVEMRVQEIERANCQV